METAKLNLTVPSDVKHKFKIKCAIDQKTITQRVVELMKSEVETTNAKKRKTRRAN